MRPEPIRVSALVALLKQSLGRAFHTVLVSGEVVDPLLSQRGHLYFRLTDGQSEIRAVMWKREADRLSALPPPGAQVTVRGCLDLYAPRGDLQLVVSAMMRSGRGQKLLELARLKEKLKTEGLFDRPRRPLPGQPQTVGLVTSVGSAVLHDIYQSVQARFPSCRLLLSPTSVSGASAPEELVRALQRLRGLTDVVIVARGGGSFEELLPFSSEELVRAVADFPQPVVSAVGHGSDVTLLDLAADHTAPTPTAAAVLVTPDRSELRERLRVKERRLTRSLLNLLAGRRRELVLWAERCERCHPKLEVERRRDSLSETRQRLFTLSLEFAHRRNLFESLLFRLERCRPLRRVETERRELGRLREFLLRAFKSELARRRMELLQMEQRLRSSSPHSVLERGYALVKFENRVVTSVKGRTMGEEMELHFADGRLVVTIKEIG